MVWVDQAIIGIVALSAFVGLMRGLMREVLSFVIWLGALLIAWTFHKDLAPTLLRWLPDPTVRLGVAFAILVSSMLVLGAIFGYLLSILVRKSGLIGTDRVLGMIFGAARGAILIAMLVFLAALMPLTEEDWWQRSSLIGRFQVLAQRVLDHVPPMAVDRLKRL